MDKSYLAELTEAEKRSTEIIRGAQEARERRLMEAKTDAEQELTNKRADLEQEYQSAASKMDHGDQSLDEIRQKYAQKAQEVQQQFGENSDAALDFLVQRVLSMTLEVPAVVIGKFE